MAIRSFDETRSFDDCWSFLGWYSENSPLQTLQVIQGQNLRGSPRVCTRPAVRKRGAVPAAMGELGASRGSLICVAMCCCSLVLLVREGRAREQAEGALPVERGGYGLNMRGMPKAPNTREFRCFQNSAAVSQPPALRSPQVNLCVFCPLFGAGCSCPLNSRRPAVAAAMLPLPEVITSC